MSDKDHLSMKEVADTLGVHRNTLQYKLRQLGLSQQFSDISDDELDLILKIYKQLRPNSGLRYTFGFLCRHGLKIQRSWVCDSLERIDGLGRALWCHDGILRCQYQSRYSNAIWHIDGLHKLILWGYVIQGTIDGHDHMARSELNYLFCPGLHVSKVTGLRASTNNRASTVLALFEESIKAHGCPSCVCGDRGGGNIDVAVRMIMYQGPG